MMARNPESDHHEDAPRSGLFMESSPNSFLTELPLDGRQLVRKFTIAGGTAVVVYLVTQLLFGIVAAW
jgi:hypothetical protein